MPTPNLHFLEKNQVVSAIVPVDLAAGANNGDWVCLKEYGRCAIIFFTGAGHSGDDPTLTLNQALNVSGGSSKALNFTRADVKQATALTSVGLFTTVIQAAANTFTEAGSAALQKVWVIDIKAEDLDINNGFNCLQLAVADVGTTSEYGCALYILHDPREMSELLPDATIN